MMIGQFTRDVLKMLDEAHRIGSHDRKMLIESLKATLLDSVKFYVADLGPPKVADILRGLPEHYSLPFERIALEWFEPLDSKGIGSKTVTMAVQQPDSIAITSFSYFYKNSNDQWVPTGLSMDVPRNKKELNLHFVSGKDCTYTTTIFKWPTIGHNEEGEEAATRCLFQDGMKLLQLLAMLSCSNVDATQEVEPPKKLSKAATRHHRYPFFTYKILTLGGSSINHGTSRGGTHASPRMHVRRGHIRHREESGKQYWVNAHVVGRAERGIILKDYQMAAQQN